MDNKYYSITALNRAIKNMFEREPALLDIYIKGEISNFKHHTRGQQGHKEGGRAYKEWHKKQRIGAHAAKVEPHSDPRAAKRQKRQQKGDIPLFQSYRNNFRYDWKHFTGSPRIIR